MSSRFARLLLLVTALWLPVQTMAALSMPLCRHAQEQAASFAAEHAGEAMHCHDEAAVDQVAHDAGCDNCALCHMAGASFMPSAALVAGLAPVGNDYSLPAPSAPPSHIAEPPQHPPRHSA